MIPALLNINHCLRYASSMSRIWVLLSSLILFGACSSEADRKKADEELVLQVKFDATRRALEEIKSRQRRGQPIAADCKAAKMLFLADLKRHKTQETEKLVTELLEACQKETPQYGKTP
jgi:hypothetical protein